LENHAAAKNAQQTLPLSLSYLALTDAELGNASAAVANVKTILKMREKDIASSTGGQVERAERLQTQSETPVATNGNAGAALIEAGLKTNSPEEA
jgi:hypothetical protein